MKNAAIYALIACVGFAASLGYVLGDAGSKPVLVQQTWQQALRSHGFARMPEFDSIQANSDLPWRIICKGWSNRPQQDLTAKDSSVIGFRVVSDCRTVDASPPPTP